MLPPSDFVRKLNEEFGGRLRIRWSTTTEEWLIEQKVGRMVELPDHLMRAYFRLPPWKQLRLRDHLVRLKEGYHLFGAVRPGNRMPCPYCHRTLRVPEFRFAEAKCQSCIQMGLDARFRACYWPLGESLLEHLRYTDPYRDGTRRQRDDADHSLQQKAKIEARDLSNQTEDILKDNFTRLFNIDSVGYTGREAMWEHPSCSTAIPQSPSPP